MRFTLGFVAALVLAVSISFYGYLYLEMTNEKALMSVIDKTDGEILYTHPFDSLKECNTTRVIFISMFRARSAPAAVVCT